jgi:hypothetical protein
LENGIGVTATLNHNELTTGLVSVVYRASIPAQATERTISPSRRRSQPKLSSASITTAISHSHNNSPSAVPPIIVSEDAHANGVSTPSAAVSATASSTALPPLPSLPALPSVKVPEQEEVPRKDSKTKQAADFLQTVSARDPVQQGV